MGNLCIKAPDQNERGNKSSKRKILSGYIKETINFDDQQNDNQDQGQGNDNFNYDGIIEKIQLPELINSDTTRPTFQHFKIVKQIGEGSFGKVYLVCKKSNGSPFAMKILQKDKINSDKQIEQARYERKLLEKTNQQFIVNLQYAFQSNSKLYLVMDFIQGGDLMKHLSKHGPFTESHTQFYMGEIFLAIESLHSRNIIYRDLKPANILIDSDGHIKLTDFGIAKELGIEKQTFTMCGSPEYIAPEILQAIGYDKMVDYWSMGIVFYELITRETPFMNRSLGKMYKNICDHKNLQFYIKISKQLESLISGLLNTNPRERLGSHGVQEFKNHEFFQGVNWKDLESKKIQPPWKPQISNIMDCNNFKQSYDQKNLMESLGKSYDKKSDDIFNIKDFTYEGKNTESSQAQEDKIQSYQLRLKK